MSYRRAYVLAVVLLDTGLRLSEALNLRWSQIETGIGKIRVYRQKTASWSTVPLTRRAEAALDEFKGQFQPFLNMHRAIKLLRLVIDKVCNKDPYLVQAAGRATIHSLRDTYATRLVTGGMSLYKVQDLLGHATPTMTQKYSHLEHSTVSEEALNILERR